MIPNEFETTDQNSLNVLLHSDQNPTMVVASIYNSNYDHHSPSANISMLQERILDSNDPINVWQPHQVQVPNHNQEQASYKYHYSYEYQYQSHHTQDQCQKQNEEQKQTLNHDMNQNQNDNLNLNQNQQETSSSSQRLPDGKMMQHENHFLQQYLRQTENPASDSRTATSVTSFAISCVPATISNIRQSKGKDSTPSSTTSPASASPSILTNFSTTPNILSPKELCSRSSFTNLPTSPPTPTKRVRTSHLAPLCRVQRVKPAATDDELREIYHEYTARRPIVEINLPIWVPDPVKPSLNGRHSTLRSEKTIGSVVERRAKEIFARSDIIPYIKRCSQTELKAVEKILKTCLAIDIERPGKKDFFFPWLNQQ